MVSSSMNLLLMQKTVLSANHESPLSYLRQVVHHRHLIWVLARRDLKAKYAQTFLGILWSILQPLIGLFIFVFFFQQVIDISDRVEYSYAIFAFSGMTCWYYFTFLVHQGGTALADSQDLIRKIYFPKIIPLLAKVVSGLASLGTSCGLLAILLIWEGIIPGWRICLLPVFLLLLFLVSLSISVWMNALTIRYRDVNHVIPYLIGFAIWLTPVFYPGTLIPDSYALILYLNPMAGVIEGFRWSLIPAQSFDTRYLLGLGISMVVLIGGLWYFRKIEDQIADFI